MRTGTEIWPDCYGLIEVPLGVAVLIDCFDRVNLSVAVHRSVAASWLMPIAVGVLLFPSLRRAARRFYCCVDFGSGIHRIAFDGSPENFTQEIGGSSPAMIVRALGGRFGTSPDSRRSSTCPHGLRPRCPKEPRLNARPDELRAPPICHDKAARF